VNVRLRTTWGALEYNKKYADVFWFAWKRLYRVPSPVAMKFFSSFAGGQGDRRSLMFSG